MPIAYQDLAPFYPIMPPDFNSSDYQSGSLQRRLSRAAFGRLGRNVLLCRFRLEGVDI